MSKTEVVVPVEGQQEPQAAEARRNSPRRWTSQKAISNLVVVLLSIFFAIPLLWLVLASVDSAASFELKPPHLTIANFVTSFQLDNLAALGNGLILSIVATAVGTVAAFFAAYTLSRHHIPFKNAILLGVLFLSGVPITILVVPMYEIFSYGDLLSLIPTGLLLGVTALPFQIYILKNFIDAVPIDLEEAAFIEQASMIRTLRSVVFPLTMPGLASASIFGFVNAWGSFLLPVVLISDISQEPAPVRLYGFMSATTLNYGVVAAYSIVYSLPVLILYLTMSRQFRAGFALGGAVR